VSLSILYFFIYSSALYLTSLKGLNKLLHAISPQYSPVLPEAVTPLLQKIITDSGYTHVVSAHSAQGKAILPRIAAKLDVPAVSDITSISHDESSSSTTFSRPIYAGNAIAEVKAPGSVKVKVFTVRPTAFAATSTEGGSAKVEQIEALKVEDSDLITEHIETKLTKSDRPELGVASRIVSGGRALKNAETFKATIEPLADALGAAIGASRAAVDAGYVDNSLQVNYSHPQQKNHALICNIHRLVKLEKSSHLNYISRLVSLVRFNTWQV
jgi:electron transfer flavoprotein alpha subunit